MNNRAPIKFKIPRQDLAECSAFQASSEAAQSWAQSLPITNTQLVVRMLRVAISDLNRVEIAPDVRFNIMEALRPNLQVALSSTSRRFLNQALIMPEEHQQMSELADNLYSLTTVAYILVAVHTLQQRKNIQSINPARLLCETIQRAMSFAGKKMLQSFQLHQPVQTHAWQELHQLYTLAESQQLTDLRVADKLEGSRSIATVYLQSLILGCCKPTQLRQNDLAAIYRALREWSHLIRLERPAAGNGIFLVDLDSDRPADYSSLYAYTDDDQYRLIDTGDLVAHLVALKARGSGPIEFDKDTKLPPNMLDHLISSLGSMSKRNFSRSVSGTSLGISIGLSSTHYHVAQGQTFEQVLHGKNYTSSAVERITANRFLETHEARDSWEEANPHDDHILDEDHHYHGELVDDATLAFLQDQDPVNLSPQERYPIYPVNMVDVSPGGYCLEWTAELPSSIRNGDIVGVREGDTSDWIIAVIRWVSQLKGAKSLLGVELLSPRAMPYGALIQQTKGTDAPLLRVLLLPEIKLVGQSHTLITPRAGFKERQKIILVRDGEEFLIQLLRQISATGNFAQFDFRYIKHLEQMVAEDKTGPLDSAYDSLWTSI